MLGVLVLKECWRQLSVGVDRVLASKSVGSKSPGVKGVLASTECGVEVVSVLRECWRSRSVGIRECWHQKNVGVEGVLVSNECQL